MGEQGVQERAENALLWGPSDEGGGDVSYLPQVGAEQQSPGPSGTGRGRDPGSQA